MNDTEKQTLQDYITSLNLTYTATFQPTPQPKETVKHPQLHWLITLQKDKRIMSVKYSEGCGHVKGYQQMAPYAWQHEAYRRTCETGQLYKEAFGRSITKMGQQPPPQLIDVLSCLVADSDVLNYSSYEEWGPELGYDLDSRKGEAIYRECISQSLALKNVLGFAAIEKLRELYQDY